MTFKRLLSDLCQGPLGVILDTSGRQRGHFPCKAPELRKTKDSVALVALALLALRLAASLDAMLGVTAHRRLQLRPNNKKKF